ncbi:MAG: ribose ABC transporter, partial [Planctomycetes bacterium]|nr:ribose ABC transporter [Planctomycetota bacterium]
MKLDLIRSIWPWLFLLLMSIFFEVWARLAYDASFLFNLFNIQSILTFATAPLLLGIGVTFVIIAGGIDLSIGFTMGFAAVVFAKITASLGGQDPLVALLIGIIATMLLVMIPGMINGWSIAGLHIPPFIGTLGMYGVARGMGF